MGKGHRDNHKARKKRGPIAFIKKQKRLSEQGAIKRNKCKLCGQKCRKKKLINGMCPICRERTLAALFDGKG